MPNFEGINNVMQRINTIQAQFKSPSSTAPTFSAGTAPFDMNLKIAMGAQNFTPAGNMTGPDSLQAFLNSMGATNRMGMFGSSESGQRLAEYAKQWDGKEFKPGETARCADFVSTMLKNSGTAPIGFTHQINCYEMQKMGRTIDKKDLKPGDIVYFGYTYLPVDYTHVGIYIGDGKFVHRPTADKPVRIDSLESGYYADKYSSARRMTG